MANINLSNDELYELVQDKLPESVKNIILPESTQKYQLTDNKVTPVPNSASNLLPTLPPVNNKPIVESDISVTTKVTNFMTKKSFSGFLLFVAIVVVLALCIYFTLYRIGWGVSSCLNKNYHDCGVLLTPELAPVALTGLVLL